MKRGELENFQKTVWDFYKASGRHDLPWRQPEVDGSFDPYKILVSEVMLQQTQVARVIPKFRQFLEVFPTVAALSNASLGDALSEWSGLGYNRRAKFLWQAAKIIAEDYNGIVPSQRDQLIKLPGIGANTAGAILTYAHNQRAAFIETNVRTAFIYHFFAGERNITDSTLHDLVLATLPAKDYRLWFWALMDYGTYLKQTVGNLSVHSKTFAKQSAFKGSKRQIRGKVLKVLRQGKSTKAQLVKQIADDRLKIVLADLVKEGLITQIGDTYMLP